MSMWVFFFYYIKMDSKYKNGKIYKLVSTGTPIVYYGSTITSLEKRLSIHKSGRNTCASRELFDAGDVSIVLVEEYPCNNKYELESRERIYIEFILNNFSHRVICNKQIPTRTKEEWYQDNREHRNEYDRKYYQNNKDSINEKKREKFNCECGGRYTRSGKSKHFKTKQHLDYIKSLKNEMSKKNLK